MTGMLIALMRKELLVLRRDLHGMAALFLMPVLFIVVMSLALKNAYDPPTGTLVYAVEVRDAGEAATALIAAWEEMNGKPSALAPADVAAALAAGRIQYQLIVEPGFSDELQRSALPTVAQLRLIAEPGLDHHQFQSTQARLHALASELKVRSLLAAAGADEGLGSMRSLVHAERLEAGGPRPTSVQHNVPAWLVFGMFFVVASLSGLLVHERASGVLARLASVGVPRSVLLASKALPYVGVNTLQAALMLAVGVWLMPWLGGEALSLRGANVAALLLVLAAISAAAVSLALLLACLVRSDAQAYAVGPIVNVLMGAVGGVMVPRFVMPPSMQAVADWSPMSWGLEALLTVLVRGGDVSATLPQVARLGVFAALALGLALWLFQRASVSRS